MNKLKLLNKELNTDYKSLEEAYERIDWRNISINKELSEEFIEKHSDKFSWSNISSYQKLSEDFIEKHSDEVDWYSISSHQKLSEEFIEKHKDKVRWYCISVYQKLSEEFLEKHSDKIPWSNISSYQKLSEDFIEKHKDKVSWDCISAYQKLSEEFIEKHSDKIDKKSQLKSNHDKRTEEDKRKEMQDYANKRNLKFKNDFLYCFRNHDRLGRGMFNNTITYEKGNYYKDWHCDLNTAHNNSFGLGAWNEGNTPIRIHVKDWGIFLNGNHDFKIRCFGFEMI